MLRSFLQELLFAAISDAVYIHSGKVTRYPPKNMVYIGMALRNLLNLLNVINLYISYGLSEMKEKAYIMLTICGNISI